MQPQYKDDIPIDATILTRVEYIESVKCHALIDYDGYGYPVDCNKMAKNFMLWPSQLEHLPEDCTHVVWFNR